MPFLNSLRGEKKFSYHQADQGETLNDNTSVNLVKTFICSIEEHRLDFSSSETML